MIQVNKSHIIPNHLKTKGLAEKIKDMIDFNCDPAPFVNFERGTPKKDFDNGIYGHKNVKAQLKQDQHDKCCYCESKFTTNSPGDVEHFRPKARFKIPGVNGYHKPAYYWLAYDWSNLFFSCEVCNREYKKDKFPLLENDCRATPHINKYPLDEESPILISPLEDPSDHIEFDKDTIIGKDIRGKKSIEHYGLKRKGLLDDRLSAYNRLKNIGHLKGDLNRVTQDIVDSINNAFNVNYTVDSLKEIFQENNDFIANAMSDAGEFSLMARMNFR